MTRVSVTSLITLLAAVTVAGCALSTSDSGGSPFGIAIITTQGGTGAYVMTPSIAFYRVPGAQLINSNVSQDTCFVTTYSAGADTGSTFATTVSAGAYVAFTVGATTDTLKRSNALDPYYRASASLDFTPGDSMIVTVPGDPNGFPASEFRAGTAEAFTVDPITSVVEGDDVPVTWTPSPVTGSAMLMSFRYAADSLDLNTQVACSFIDDGSAVVPGGTIVNWERATVREAQAQRVRSLISQLDVPRAYFNIASVFTQSITTP